MKAWLVTWEWSNVINAVGDKVVALFNPRYRAQRITPIVDYIFTSAFSNVSELAHYAKKTSNNPYPAKIEGNGWISCGFNPFLFARVVSELKVETDTKTNLEVITWKEPSRYEYAHGKVVLVHEGARKKYTRSITGPISHMSIWDRAKGEYKEEWKLKLKNSQIE